MVGLGKGSLFRGASYPHSAPRNLNIQCHDWGVLANRAQNMIDIIGCFFKNSRRRKSFPWLGRRGIQLYLLQIYWGHFGTHLRMLFIFPLKKVIVEYLRWRILYSWKISSPRILYWFCVTFVVTNDLSFRVGVSHALIRANSPTFSL